MKEDPMFVAHYKTLLGRTNAVISVTTSGNQGSRLISTVKPGNQFWAWSTLPGTSLLASIDFTWTPPSGEFSWGAGAPVCTDDATANLAILAELAEIGPAPSDVLTFVA